MKERTSLKGAVDSVVRQGTMPVHVRRKEQSRQTKVFTWIYSNYLIAYVLVVYHGEFGRGLAQVGGSPMEYVICCFTIIFTIIPSLEAKLTSFEACFTSTTRLKDAGVRESVAHD